MRPSGWPKSGLTARQYNYLSVIYVEERVTPNEIGRLIHTANPTVTSMLNALERDGLVVREQHPEDGRSSVVTLTPRGKALYENAFQLHHDPLEETMAALSATSATSWSTCWCAWAMPSLRTSGALLQLQRGLPGGVRAGIASTIPGRRGSQPSRWRAFSDVINSF